MKVQICNRLCPCRSPSTNSPIEQQIGATLVLFHPVENIVGPDVRDQLVVNTYPRCPRSIGQVTIGVQNVQRIMASVCGLSMMIQNWINSQHQIDVTQSE